MSQIGRFSTRRRLAAHFRPTLVSPRKLVLGACLCVRGRARVWLPNERRGTISARFAWTAHAKATNFNNFHCISHSLAIHLFALMAHHARFQCDLF